MNRTGFVRFLLLVLFSLGSLIPVRGEVLDSAAGGFTVKNTVIIAAPPTAVYRQLVNIGRWWDPEHTFSGDAQNLSLDDKATGCFCEKLKGSGSVRHAVVVYAEPGKTLRMAGALGPLQSMGVAGSLTVSLSKADTGTRVELTYAVGGYLPGGLQSLASPVDRVLANQLTRLRNLVETGTPATKQ